LQVREPKVCPAQLSATEICALEVGKLKICIPQINPTEVCPLEVCAPQLCPIQALMRQIHLAEEMPVQPSKGTDVKDRPVLNIQR
jgi:hypothetical protein